MTGQQADSKPPALALRNQVIDALAERFADDGLTLDEFEAKLDVVHRAKTEEALRILLEALAPAGQPADHSTQIATQRAPEEAVKERGLVLGFWGGASRSGSWIPARKNYAVAFQGGAELDLREARFGPGVTNITVFCAMGGVNIVVPPSLQVDFGGVGIMGAFELESGAMPVFDDTAPVVRIRGLAICGGAAVEIRRHGETAVEARQRRRLSVRIAKELKPQESGKGKRIGT